MSEQKEELTKKVTVTMTPHTIEIGKEDSREWQKTFGKNKNNLSGYLTHLIHEARKKK